YPGEQLAMPCGAPADATAARPAGPAEPAAIATVGGVELRGEERPAPVAVQPAPLSDGLAERRKREYVSAPFAASPDVAAGAGRVHVLSPQLQSARDGGHALALGDEVRLELPA